MLNNIDVSGIKTQLTPINRGELKGIPIDYLVRFNFYRGSLRGTELCFIEPKSETGFTPLKYKKAVEIIQLSLNMSVVVVPSYVLPIFRQRLMAYGIYYVMPRFTFLPSIVLNADSFKERKRYKKLTPAAQLILLYHLTTDNEQSLTIKYLSNKLSLGYVTTSLAVTCLEELGLCVSHKAEDKTKLLEFIQPKKELWSKAQPFLTSPIERVYYSDDDSFAGEIKSGINALSQYSNLNNDSVMSVAIEKKEFRKSETINEIEGNYRIEVWRYSPKPLSRNGCVDKLSLYLTLSNDPDPRVESELEKMMEEIQW